MDPCDLDISLLDKPVTPSDIFTAEVYYGEHNIPFCSCTLVLFHIHAAGLTPA